MGQVSCLVVEGDAGEALGNLRNKSLFTDRAMHGETRPSPFTAFVPFIKLSRSIYILDLSVKTYAHKRKIIRILMHREREAFLFFFLQFSATCDRCDLHNASKSSHECERGGRRRREILDS